MIQSYAFSNLMFRRHPKPTLLPYTMLFRSFCTISERSFSVRTKYASRSPCGDHDIHGTEFQRPPGVARYSNPMLWSKRSEEHTSELQSRLHLVCRLLLAKKKSRSLEPECMP